jgi:hypothetical protein
MLPYGIKEIVLEFDTGEEKIMRPKLREWFDAYELHEAATYLRAGVMRGIRVGGVKGEEGIMLGIVSATGTASEASDKKYARMPQITVRYADGQELAFVPEARRRFFDEDDALKLAENLEKASQIAEWSGVEERYAR